jgi:hypothetical protein
MSSQFFYPNDFFIEEEFDLDSILPQHVTDSFLSHPLDLQPTLDQMTRFVDEYEENNDKITAEMALSDMVLLSQNNPVYQNLTNFQRKELPKIAIKPELLLKENYLVRKSLKNINFTNFEEISSICHYTFSSYKYNNGIQQLLHDDLSLYWQSDSNSTPHFMNVSLPYQENLAYVCIYIDCAADESYSPNEITIKTGLSQHSSSFSKLLQLAPPPTGWLIIPLQDFKAEIDAMGRYSIVEQMKEVFKEGNGDDDTNDPNDNNNQNNNSRNKNNNNKPKKASDMVSQTTPLIFSPIDLISHGGGGCNGGSNAKQADVVVVVGADGVVNYGNRHVQFNEELAPIQIPLELSQIHQNLQKKQLQLEEKSVIKKIQNNNNFQNFQNKQINQNTTKSTFYENNNNHSDSQTPSNQSLGLLSSQSHTNSLLSSSNSVHQESFIPKRTPSFHMSIDILSSYQLGRDCRLRGFKLFAYKN